MSDKMGEMARNKTVARKGEKRSVEDQQRLERLLNSPTTRVGTIPGEGRKGLDPKSPFYDLWRKQNSEK